MKKTHIIIHHSATDEGDIETFRDYHVNTLGWRDVGYQYVIPKSGEVQKGREEDRPGAHCRQEKMNFKSIGICLTGNFDNYFPNFDQFDSLIKLVKDIMDRYNIPTENVKMHRGYANYKSCPGELFPFHVLQKQLEE